VEHIRTISPASSGSGATITIGETAQATADSSGSYVFPAMGNGTYTLVAVKSGYTFAPASQSVTVNGRQRDRSQLHRTPARPGPAVTGQWGAPFDIGIVAVNTVLMHTGKVLMSPAHMRVPGLNACGIPRRAVSLSCRTRTTTCFCAGQSQLADGRILIVGGYDTASLGAPTPTSSIR